MTDVGARALARSPYLSRLTTLELSGNSIGDRGLEALALSDRLPSLVSLQVERVGVQARGARALVDSPLFSRLRSLDLSGNALGVIIIRVLRSLPSRPPHLVMD